MFGNPASHGNPTDGHGHDHHHDHGFAQPMVVRPARNQQAGLWTSIVDRTLRVASKAYVHTRYSTVGNRAATFIYEQGKFVTAAFNNVYSRNYQAIIADDVTIVNGDYQGIITDGLTIINGNGGSRTSYIHSDQRPSPGVNNPVGYTFSWLETIFIFFIELAEIIFTLNINLGFLFLYLVWRLARRIFRPLFVCGTLVFGARLCLAFFRSQQPIWGFPACVAFALWAAFIAVSYIDYPELWNVSSWPKWPRAIVHASRSWYRCPVVWSIVGACIIIWAQNRGITEPLFEKPLLDEPFVESLKRWFSDILDY